MKQHGLLSGRQERLYRIGAMSPFPSVESIGAVTPALFENEIRSGNRPVILKGLADDWPVAAAARKGPEALALYLAEYDTELRCKVSVLPPSERKYFYQPDLKGYNFENVERTVTQLTSQLVRMNDDGDGRAFYMQGQSMDAVLPRVAAGLNMPLFPPTVRPRFWLGNSVTTQTHYDVSANIACHIAGEKTFTLFPPEQIANLYPGPLLGGPGGVPVSLVDFDKPDMDAHPRFAEALDHAVEARLEPGDAVYIPPMWWHHVRTVGPLNMLINYWQDLVPAQAYPPLAGLLVSALSIRRLPEPLRAAWKHWVDYYVFDEGGNPTDHLPVSHHGFFEDDISEKQMAALKALVRQNI